MTSSPYLYLASVIIAIFMAIYQHSIDIVKFPLSDEDAIFVNDSAIKRVDYLTAITMINDENKRPMNAIDYQLIVDRLIEEELLFQYGLSENYIFHPEISQIIVNNILETISVQHTSQQYSDEHLYPIYLSKIKTNIDFQTNGKDPSFEEVRDQLSDALREVDRNKAIHEYILWLRQRADISSYNSVNETNLIKGVGKHE